MSCSEGKPPAVTSEANVNVQYDSILFVGTAIVGNTVKPSHPNAIYGFLPGGPTTDNDDCEIRGFLMRQRGRSQFVVLPAPYAILGTIIISDYSSPLLEMLP